MKHAPTLTLVTSLLVSLLASCTATDEVALKYDGPASIEEPEALPTATVAPEAPIETTTAFEGEVDVALFVDVVGDDWDERTREHVLSRLSSGLFEHPNIRYYPGVRTQTLGRLARERDGMSDEWLAQVRRRLSWNPPEVLVGMTLRAGPGSARSATSGKMASYPEIAIHMNVVRLDGERRCTVVEKGHELVYDSIARGAAEKLQAALLTRIMR